MNVQFSIRLRFAEGAAVTARSSCGIRNGTFGTFQPLTKVAGAFTGSMGLADDPNGAVGIDVALAGQEFWDQTLSFNIIMVFGSPLLVGGDGAVLQQSVTGTMMTGLTVNLDLAVSRLKNVTGTILPTIDDEFMVYDFDANILAPLSGGVVTGQFLKPDFVSINAWSLYFFQYIGGRSVIGVYVPNSAKPINGRYVFYFKPPKHAGHSVKSVAEIYLTAADTNFHQMLANCELAGSLAVFCFLFGESGNPEVVANARVVSNILTEVDRHLRGGLELSINTGVEAVALACFSEGGRLMNNAMAGLNASPLAATLKGVFIYDAWFGTGQLEIFRGRLRSWFGAGAEGKVVRIYQGIAVDDPDLYAGVKEGRITGPHGSVQKMVGGDESFPSYYYLRVNDPFIRSQAPGVVPPNDLHHAVPKLFLTHSLKTTMF